MRAGLPRQRGPGIGRHRAAPRDRGAAGPPAGFAFGRRGAAGRDRARAAVRAGHPADGRAAGGARRGAQGRDPALSRTAARPTPGCRSCMSATISPKWRGSPIIWSARGRARLAGRPPRRAARRSGDWSTDGLREAGAVLPGARLRPFGRWRDGTRNSRAACSSCRASRRRPAPVLRVRILAQDVMLAVERPRGISALNILPVEVLALGAASGPGVIGQLRAGADTLLARITRRSADALDLPVGSACFAVLKSVAVRRPISAAGLAELPACHRFSG